MAPPPPAPGLNESTGGPTMFKRVNQTNKQKNKRQSVADRLPLFFWISGHDFYIFSIFSVCACVSVLVCVR